MQSVSIFNIIGA